MPEKENRICIAVRSSAAAPAATGRSRAEAVMPPGRRRRCKSRSWSQSERSWARGQPRSLGRRAPVPVLPATSPHQLASSVERLNPKAKAGSVALAPPGEEDPFVSTWEYLKDQVLLDKARFHSCIEFSNASCPEVSALMKIVEEARQNQGKALLAHLNRSINQLAHACSRARADMDRIAGPRAGASAARSHRRRAREQGSRTTVWKHTSLRMCSF